MKPPAFQFYVKDWNSSPTVAQMSLHDRGVYITLLAAAWDSDEPGTLPLPVKIAAKISRISEKNIRNFLEIYPQTFKQIDGKLVNDKLRRNWFNYKEISEKRRKAAESRYSANAEQKHQSASASASAPKSIKNPPTPLKSGGGEGVPELKIKPEQLLEIWQANRGELPEVRDLTPERKRKCAARIANHRSQPEKFIADFKEAVRKSATTPFLRGDSGGWKANFDFLIANETNYLKVLEGRYDRAEVRLNEDTSHLE